MILRTHNILIAFTLTFLSCGTVLGAAQKKAISAEQLKEFATLIETLKTDPFFCTLATIYYPIETKTEKEFKKKENILNAQYGLLKREAISTEQSRDKKEKTIYTHSFSKELMEYFAYLPRGTKNHGALQAAIGNMSNIVDTMLRIKEDPLYEESIMYIDKLIPEDAKDTFKQDFLAEFEKTKAQCAYKKHMLSHPNPAIRILYNTNTLPSFSFMSIHPLCFPQKPKLELPALNLPNPGVD